MTQKRNTKVEDVLAFIEQIPDATDRLARMSHFVLNQAHILCQWSQGRTLKVADVRRIAAVLEKGLRDIDASPDVLNTWHGRALRHTFATCPWGLDAVHTAVDFARRVRGCLPQDLRGTAWTKRAQENLLAVLGNCTMTELNGQCIILDREITMEQADQIDEQQHEKVSSEKRWTRWVNGWEPILKRLRCSSKHDLDILTRSQGWEVETRLDNRQRHRININSVDDEKTRRDLEALL